MIYIAGPMRGIKYYNFPEFFAAEKHLQDLGVHAFNPAHQDLLEGINPFLYPEDYDWSKEPKEINQRVFVQRAYKALFGCHAIYMLKGWKKSTGAQAEYWIARWLGLGIKGAK